MAQALATSYHFGVFKAKLLQKDMLAYGKSKQEALYDPRDTMHSPTIWLLDELQIKVRPQESGQRVFLHQGVNLLLGHVEAGG